VGTAGAFGMLGAGPRLSLGERNAPTPSFALWVAQRFSAAIRAHPKLTLSFRTGLKAR